jgi:DNA gyrase/topoisomerase IV subunit A
MKKFIPEYYRNYGQYSNFRNFPMITDGLKPVERRVLLAAYKVARDKFAKSRQVDAYTIGHYHPHGETYGTIVKLVRQGLLIGQGNWGSNVGVQPVGAAAPRYTECKSSPTTLEMAFKYVKHVEWVDTELGDKEPIYLPTMYPICLLGNEYTQGIGFGYKTFIPCYSKKDLKKRLLWLIGGQLRKTEPIIKPKTDCTITAKNKILKELLTIGKAKIDVEGIIEEVPHQTKVILKSWPPGKRFESFLKKFTTELDSNMIGFTDLSVQDTQIVFQVIRQRSRDNIYQDFVKKLKELLIGQISFDMKLVNEQHEVVTASVDTLLKNSYNNYKKAVGTMLEREIDNILSTSTDYKTLLRIRPSLKKHMTGISSITAKVKLISKESNVKVETVERLLKLNIKRLLTMELDIDELKNKLKGVQDNLENIDQYILDQYQSL